MNGALAVQVAIVFAAASLALPALVYTVQCLLGSLPWRDRRAPAPLRPMRVAVLVPAHNESSGIRATVVDLLAQLATGDRLVVVADNCTDDTAAVACAAASGVASTASLVVLERRDANRRGKGHALAHGRAHLAADPPDVVVFVDADCRIDRGTVRELAQWAAASGGPVQADYLLQRPANGSSLAALGAFAVLVRNRVRPRGMSRLGLPCQITGSGMAMPWAASASTERLGANIVEDLVLGLELALAGTPPRACPEVRVLSELPSRDDDAARQRRRWEHGQMATALAWAPRLLFAGVLRVRPALVAQALDLLVPPMALLTALLLGSLAAAFVLWLATGAGTALAIAAVALGAVALATLVAWAAHARDVLPLRQLLAVPFYVLWKVPLYLGFVRRRERNWQRTRRDTDTPP
jgi:cellulose synthase/poly-beta-1,6-N-acetylglucosamine synthase-like glycosyltransferase